MYFTILPYANILAQYFWVHKNLGSLRSQLWGYISLHQTKRPSKCKLTMEISDGFILVSPKNQELVLTVYYDIQWDSKNVT